MELMLVWDSWGKPEEKQQWGMQEELLTDQREELWHCTAEGHRFNTSFPTPKPNLHHKLLGTCCHRLTKLFLVSARRCQIKISLLVINSEPGWYMQLSVCAATLMHNLCTHSILEAAWEVRGGALGYSLALKCLKKQKYNWSKSILHI